MNKKLFKYLFYIILLVEFVLIHLVYIKFRNSVISIYDNWVSGKWYNYSIIFSECKYLYSLIKYFVIEKIGFGDILLSTLLYFFRNHLFILPFILAVYNSIFFIRKSILYYKDSEFKLSSVSFMYLRCIIMNLIMIGFAYGFISVFENIKLSI